MVEESESLTIRLLQEMRFDIKDLRTEVHDLRTEMNEMREDLTNRIDGITILQNMVAGLGSNHEQRIAAFE